MDGYIKVMNSGQNKLAFKLDTMCGANSTFIHDKEQELPRQFGIHFWPKGEGGEGQHVYGKSWDEVLGAAIKRVGK